MTFWPEDKKQAYKELKQARYNILLYMRHLDMARCDKCINSGTGHTKCECEAAVKVREYGQILLGNKLDIIKTYKELLKVQGLATLTEANLTVDKYKDLKATGMTDSAIQKQLGWHGMKWNEWKRENGLIGKRIGAAAEQPKKEIQPVKEPVKVEAVPEVPVSQDKHWVERAVSETSFKHRILETIAKQIDRQTEKGVGKYNHTLEDCPPDKYDWQNMITEELIDALQYQQKEMARLRSVSVDSLNQYQKATERTERQDLTEKDLLLNYGLGISGESGEIADMVKKHFFQGHDLDTEALKKEIGDVLYYAARLSAVFGFKLSDVADSNIKKLKKRFPKGFKVEDSIKRADTDDH